MRLFLLTSFSESENTKIDKKINVVYKPIKSLVVKLISLKNFLISYIVIFYNKYESRRFLFIWCQKNALLKWLFRGTARPTRSVNKEIDKAINDNSFFLFFATTDFLLFVILSSLLSRGSN